MAPAIRDVGLHIANELIRGSKGKGKHDGKLRPTPIFMTARNRNFYILFSWARVTEETFWWALMLVFVAVVLCTILMQVLAELERTTLARRHSRVTAGERLIAGMSYALRMGIMYILIISLMSQNLYVLITILMGHLFGWVIHSGLGGQAAEQARLQATIQALRKEQEQQKRKKEKELDLDIDITDCDEDEDESQCDKKV